MKRLKHLSVGLIVLLGLALAAIYLMPLDAYVPRVERALGEQLHEPVGIRHIRIATLPLPHLELQDVRLGERDGIAVRVVEVFPEWTGLLAGKVALRRIVIKDGTAHLGQVRELVALLGGADAAQGVTVRELQLSGMSLLAPAMTLGPIDGKLEFGASGRMERAWFAMDGQKLTATLLPLPERRFSLQAQAREWTPPQLPRMQIKNLHLEGVLSEQDSAPHNLRFAGDIHITGLSARLSGNSRNPLILDEIGARLAAQAERLELSSLRMKLYGGKLSGTASFSSKDAMLNAELSADGIALQSLVKAVTDEVLFAGSMEGAAKFSMRMGSFERFTENLRLSGNFHLRDGMLGKVDLVQAASSTGKADNKGGTTRFDDLTGLLSVDTGGYHFKDLKIVSGSLKAGGKLDINPSLQLDGALDANIKGMGGLVSMPLVVSGTLHGPVVRPSTAAMAGAAVGTAILGPGLGTATGIKVGGFLNKLFGKNDNSKSDKVPASGVPAKK